MGTLHTFGCSITQGFALPDIVRPLTDAEIDQLGRPFHWTDVHLLQPSRLAWPQLLANHVGMPVVNHARRGACFQQIATQCAVATDQIQPQDTVIVMWTYLSRISLQWPARTTVPLCNMVDTRSWRTRILPGWNRFFGLSPAATESSNEDAHIQKYIHDSTRYTYMNPMGVYDQYYRSLVLQVMTDGHLRATGARVIHLSVEPESYTEQLEHARGQLPPSLRDPHTLALPSTWYRISVDHDLCHIIHDPSIPPAANDMHPSEQHHSLFARELVLKYF